MVGILLLLFYSSENGINQDVIDKEWLDSPGIPKILNQERFIKGNKLIEQVVSEVCFWSQNKMRQSWALLSLRTFSFNNSSKFFVSNISFHFDTFYSSLESFALFLSAIFFSRYDRWPSGKQSTLIFELKIRVSWKRRPVRSYRTLTSISRRSSSVYSWSISFSPAGYVKRR